MPAEFTRAPLFQLNHMSDCSVQVHNQDYILKLLHSSDDLICEVKGQTTGTQGVIPLQSHCHKRYHKLPPFHIKFP